MRLWLVMLVTIAPLAAGPARADADPAKRAAAERLADTYDYDEMVATMVKGMATMLPPEQRSSFVDRLTAFMTRDRMRQLQVEIAENSLELDELDALADFYASPMGQRIRAKEARMAVYAVQRQQCLVLPLIRDLLLDGLAAQVPQEQLAAARDQLQQSLDAEFRQCATL